MLAVGAAAARSSSKPLLQRASSLLLHGPRQGAPPHLFLLLAHAPSNDATTISHCPLPSAFLPASSEPPALPLRIHAMPCPSMQVGGAGSSGGQTSFAQADAICRANTSCRE